MQETGCHAVISLQNKNVTLFIPRMDPTYKIWMKVMEEDDFKEIYPDFDILYNDQLEQFVKENGRD